MMTWMENYAVQERLPGSKLLVDWILHCLIIWGFHTWGYPKWKVYKRTSNEDGWWLGVPPILGNLHIFNPSHIKDPHSLVPKCPRYVVSSPLCSTTFFQGFDMGGKDEFSRGTSVPIDIPTYPMMYQCCFHFFFLRHAVCLTKPTINITFKLWIYCTCRMFAWFIFDEWKSLSPQLE